MARWMLFGFIVVIFLISGCTHAVEQEQALLSIADIFEELKKDIGANRK